MKKQTILLLLIITLFCGATFAPSAVGGFSVLKNAQISAEKSIAQSFVEGGNTDTNPFALLGNTDFSGKQALFSNERFESSGKQILFSGKESGDKQTLFADEERLLTPTRIAGNSNIDFLHIEEISAFVGGDGLYFSDGKSIYKNSDAVTQKGANGIALYQGKALYTNNEGSTKGIFYKDICIASTANGFGAIAVLGDRILAAAGNSVFIYSVDYTSTTDSFTLAEIGSPFTFPAAVVQLVSSSEAVYARLNGQNTIRKIYQNGDGLASGETTSVSNLKAIAASPSSPRIFCLTNNSVTSYTEDSGVLLSPKTMQSGGATHLAAGENKIYLAYYDDGSFNIDEATHDFAAQKTIIAGRSDADYFYNSPLGISSRFGEIFVADAGNNRISRLGGGGVNHLTTFTDSGTENNFDQPSSAALSLEGELYVAHKNKLTLTSTGKTLTLKDPSGNNLIAEKILLSSSGNVYVLAVQPITRIGYAFSADHALSALSLLDFTNPSAIGYKAGGEVLFFEPDGEIGTGYGAASTGAIKNLNGDTLLECGFLKDFCVDYAGTVFGLDFEGKLVSVKGGTKTNHGGKYDKIALSSVTNALCGYGDVLLVETATNSLKKISAAEAGVADVSSHFTIPDIENDFSAHAKTDRFVAAARYDAPIFAQPSEATVAYTAPKDSDVFIRYDIAAPEDMYFVLTEDVDGQALRWGYIYRSALTAPYPYIMPPKNAARVIIDFGDYGFIYKYPSVFSNAVATVAKGDVLKLLYFAANRPEDSTDKSDGWFEDSRQRKWLRVDYGAGEGYVLEEGLSWSLFSSNSSQPNTNATIIENAPLYVFNSATQKYEFLDGVLFLPKGQRVEVKTPFDSSSKYTQVIYSVEIDGAVEVIDITVFVETKCIDYDGVDILQIVAICALIIAVILLISLAIWLIRKRRRRAYDLD